ncbi:uncharacterized protein LOC108199950 [Daucus carota subsp. sativus]|uniref:uncharacterized protein LOC108199950 n=1 Tax=Daucus carota subsp. sativus TaxID=79200 RepID=UPI003082722C
MNLQLFPQSDTINGICRTLTKLSPAENKDRVGDIMDLPHSHWVSIKEIEENKFSCVDEHRGLGSVACSKSVEEVVWPKRAPEIWWPVEIKMEHNSERGPQGDGVLGGVVSAGDAGVVAANGGGAAVDSVLRPNNHGEDVEEMKKKMESLEEKLKETEEKLKEKDEDFESLQDSYQALLVKERNNNDQLEDARKKLINVLKDRRTNMRAYTGVKLMGDLNLKPIFAATKKKYPPAEVELKAMEFSSLLEEKLRDPNWYPFKVITFGEDSKRVIND